MKRNVSKIVIASVLLLFPFVWVNTALNDDEFNYRKFRMKYLDTHSAGELLSFYNNAITNYADDPRVNIDYLSYTEYWSLDYYQNELAEKYKSKLATDPDDDLTRELSVIAYEITRNQAFSYSLPLVVKDTASELFIFAKGCEAILNDDLVRAEQYYILALSDNSINDLVYPRLDFLMTYYLSYDEIKELAYNHEVFKWMSFNKKRLIYLEDGSYVWYMYNAIYRDFLSANIFAYIAVILAMSIWLLFILKMLFIKNDKLKFVALLFVLGAILPVLVYVFGDILDFVYSKFGITMDEKHFWYNWINIGMVEEIVKMIPWVLVFFIFRNKFQRPVHYMLLPIVSAMGFAFSENLIYINSLDYELVFVRSTICVAIHISCSSLIGYAFYRGRLKGNTYTTILYVVIGFLLGSLIHGLYDYFIFRGYRILNILTYLIGMHVFILCINNVLNFSNITDKKATKNLRSAGAFLIIGLAVIYICQYYIIGLEYSVYAANKMLEANLLFVLITLVYLVSMFRKIRLRPNVLYTFSFTDVFGQFFKTSEGHYDDTVDYRDKQFKLFAPKDNALVGSQFPIKATALHSIEVQERDDWWMIRFEKSVYVGYCHPEYALIRCKNDDEELFMEKVELIVFMIPNYDAFMARAKHHSKDFNYIGRVYSRPVE